MPFGAIFGALFFAVLGSWFGLGAGGFAGGPLGPARPFVALICLALATGLLLRRSWARWSGVLWSGALTLFVLLLAMLGAGVAAYLVLFGSLATAVLLLVPATGNVRSPALAGRPAAPRLGRIAAASAAIGAIGLLAGLGWGVSRAPSQSGVPLSARQAIGLPERVRWSDFGSGLEQARAEDKTMLVTFVTNWCGYCRKMDRTTWQDPSVVERMAEMVAVRVDAEDGRSRNGFTGRGLAAEYGVSGFPTLMLVDREGAVISTSGGYQTPGQFLRWLESALGQAGHSTAGAVRASGP